LFMKNSKQVPIQSPPPMPVAAISTSTAPITSTSTAPTQATSTSETKIYRNEQWGFEFQYPINLIVRENTFGGYYSKFNVEIVAKQGKYLDTVLLVNVVLPEFADRTFLSMSATTSTVIIAGISGIKYEYEFEGLPEVAIVLPFEQYKVILGREGSTMQHEYDNYVNQIFTSFKFLK
ncbi:MAG: hypothetical protein AAB759_01675, partial [Patescibacteria group bacterium]